MRIDWQPRRFGPLRQKFRWLRLLILRSLSDFFRVTSLLARSDGQVVSINATGGNFTECPTGEYRVEESRDSDHEGKHKLPAVMRFRIREMLMHEPLKSRLFWGIACFCLGVAISLPSIFYVIASFMFGVRPGYDRYLLWSSIGIVVAFVCTHFGLHLLLS